MALSEKEMLAILDIRLAELRAAEPGARHPMWIDWRLLFNRESQAEWLVRDLWPAYRQVHVHATRKTGKSLVSLWIACKLATGRDPFTGDAIEPVNVAYLDYEMTEDDLLERVEEMGFTADDLEPHLFYAFHPTIPPLDTHDGGQQLVERLVEAHAQAVVIDTFSRVVGGDENSNDTYRAFFRHTGMPLKHAGIAMLRLDHEGHLEGRSRGASAKADDVDVVWQLKRGDGGLTFNRMAARMSWVPETVAITQCEPLAFVRTTVIIPNGTMEKVAQLDEIDAPIDISRREAQKLLIANGYTAGKTVVLNAAINHRKNRILGL